MRSQEEPVTNPSLRVLAQALWAPRTLASALEAERARWSLPALVIIGGLMVMDLLALPLFFRALPQMAPVGLSPDMLAQLERTARLMRPIQIALSPLGLLLKWALTAALLFGMQLLLRRPASEAEREPLVPVRKLFALVVYANLPLLLGEILRNLILWLRYLLAGEIVWNPAIGLDALVRPSDVAFRVLLQQVNPFDVWFLIVLVEGVSALCRSSRRRAMALVLPVWSLGVLWAIGLALVREVLTRQLGG